MKCKKGGDQEKADTTQKCRTCGKLGLMTKDCYKKGAQGNVSVVRHIVGRRAPSSPAAFYASTRFDKTRSQGDSVHRPCDKPLPTKASSASLASRMVL